MRATPRRDFLKDAFAFLLSLPFMTGLGVVFRYLQPGELVQRGEGVITDEAGRRLRLSWIPDGSVARGFLNGEPVLIVRREGTPHVLSAKCTHLACTVRSDAPSNEFTCPCHGARFDRSGAVLAGPASRPLRPIAIAVMDDVMVTPDVKELPREQHS